MTAQLRLAALMCCLLTGCNTSQPPPLNQQALAGNYVCRSVDTSVDKPTDHQLDRLTLKADGTYDLVQGGSTKARSEKTGGWTIQPGDPPNVLLFPLGSARSAGAESSFSASLRPLTRRAENARA